MFGHDEKDWGESVQPVWVDNVYEVSEIIRETELSFLVLVKEPENKECWFPKKHCAVKDGSLLVPGWLSKAKGFHPHNMELHED